MARIGRLSRSLRSRPEKDPNEDPPDELPEEAAERLLSKLRSAPPVRAYEDVIDAWELNYNLGKVIECIASGDPDRLVEAEAFLAREIARTNRLPPP